MNENLNSVQQNEESSMPLSDIWHLIWDYKWWYVLSVAVCIMIAVFYLYVTPPEYVRVAKVIINEDVQSNVMSDLITMAGGAGSDSFSSNANNEAEAFASPDLMEKVVNQSQRHEQHAPHEKDKQSQHRRECKGIERGVEIIVHPCLWRKTLDTGIQRGGQHDTTTQEHRIDAVDMLRTQGTTRVTARTTIQIEKDESSDDDYKNACTQAAEPVDEP